MSASAKRCVTHGAVSMLPPSIRRMIRRNVSGGAFRLEQSVVSRRWKFESSKAMLLNQANEHDSPAWRDAIKCSGHRLRVPRRIDDDRRHFAADSLQLTWSLLKTL
jgi:hypothetical protein